jgi:oligopeptide transport system substrate-binding protein
MCRTRRQFAAIGITSLALAPWLLASPDRVVGQSATPEAGFTVILQAQDEPSSATPRGDQVLRLTGPIDPITSFDPALARDFSSAFFARQLFRGLVHLDENLEVKPELAQTVEVSDDGLVYRFTLREGASFQDGTPITARHVVGSLARALDPDTAGGDLSILAGPSYLNDILGAADVVANRTDELAGARVIDERTVEIELSAPRSTFLMKLSAPPGSVVDLDQATSNPEWWVNPNASGPFRIASWTPDELLVLEPFANYAAGAPALERVDIRLGPSAANAFNLYQSGQIDVTGVPINALDRIMDPNEGVSGELSVVPFFSINFIVFAMSEPPLDDPAIREALIHAFPREQLVDVTFGDRKLAAEGILPPDLLGREWPVQGSEYDLEKARAALARSRYDVNDLPPIRIYGAGPFAAETLRDTVKETLGIEIEVISMEWADLATAMARQELPAYEFMWIADYPDPETFLWSLFASDSPDNYSGYNNPAYDALLAKAAATLDIEERAAIYLEAQQLLFDDKVALPVVHDIRYTLSQPTVKGLQVTPLGILELDSVWMEQ